jgi:hypothetical protein
MAALVLVAGAAWLTLGRIRVVPPADETARPAAPAIAHAPASPRPRDLPARAESGPPAAAPGEDAGAELDFDAMSDPWAEVDLEQARAALPDNRYWTVAAPTTDERVLAARAAERARWNVEYGKVLSGTASEDEIRAYFDHKARLSADYVELTTYLLDHYGETLPERDVGLLQLARKLHHARLEEYPRKIEEAFERKRAQDAARAAWLADEQAFRDGGGEATH